MSITQSKQTEPNQNDPEPKTEPNATEPKQQAAGADPEPKTEPGDPIDKHGEPAINKGRYDRDMKAKDDEIAALKKQLEEANGKAETGDKALKEVADLKAQLADEKLDHLLQVAGCVNAKAAKALLPDYDGDVSKLKEDCPYLFKAKQTGTTGTRRQTLPSDDEDEALDKAFGLKK